MKSALTGLYWLFSLALVAGAIFLLFSAPGLLKHRAAPDDTKAGMPPMPVPAPAEEKDSRISYDIPRSQNPLGDLTKFYTRKEILVGQPPRKHTLTYYLYAPAKPYPDGLTFPLVLVLHDVMGDAPAGEYLIEGDMPVKHPAFVVVPVLPYGKVWSMPDKFPELQNFQPSDRAWDGIKDVPQLINDLKQKYPIDDKRIYVVGCAEGGFGAFGAALHYPKIFAASVPVNSGWAVGDAKGFAKVPLWVFHGADDGTYLPQLSRDAASYIDAYGGKANYTEVPNAGHDCTTDRFYLPQMWDWLFKQHK